MVVREEGKHVSVRDRSSWQLHRTLPDEATIIHQNLQSLGTMGQDTVTRLALSSVLGLLCFTKEQGTTPRGGAHL